MLEQICKKCNVIKPLNQFAKSSSCRTGYRHVCKSCRLSQAKITAKISQQNYPILTHKICNDCSTEKSIFEFSKESVSVDGYRNCCKVCRAKSRREYNEKNKEILRALNELNYAIFTEDYKRSSAKYRQNNPTKVKEQASTWKKKNKDRCNANHAKYRASKIKATPTWLTIEHLEQMRLIYERCEQLTLDTGIMHHVDHIIPLRGETVCGLHVPWNLQILTAFENISKHNHIPKEYAW